MELDIPPDDIFFNLILVQENVRPAMLIQTINYSKTIIKNILQYIELRFPNLILTKEYKGYQGIIVSKNDYTSEHFITKKIILGLFNDTNFKFQ
jgi:hypothetical protein